MTLAAIEQTLINEYVKSDFDIDTSYENRLFDPALYEKWARISVIPNQPMIATMGSEGEDMHTGLMQIDLFYPQNEGKGCASAKADEIRKIFKGGARLLYNNQMVIISNCGCGAGINENGFYKLSIKIEWWARTQRTIN